MVYKFRIVSDEVDNFRLEIMIDAEDTFLRLRNAILDAVGYTKDEMNSFFICDDDWCKEKEITLMDMGSDSDQDIWLMDETHLNELIEDEGQKMSFMFDYMTERSFFMELKEVITGKTLKDPVCNIKAGEAPKQFVDIEEMNAKATKDVTTANPDYLDDDSYGDESFNDDELGEGFENLPDGEE
ncbi:MAG: hypothetical protein LKF31_10270 [Muribaculaceae bacterium]|jgi:hypothetical protein|nr:hypothetical protein [Muribaculaceae bacterium]